MSPSFLEIKAQCQAPGCLKGYLTTQEAFEAQQSCCPFCKSTKARDLGEYQR